MRITLPRTSTDITALAMLPDRASAILLSIMTDLQRGPSLTEQTVEIDPLAADFYYLGSTDRRPYSVVDGVALIPVDGDLCPDISWSGYGYTGYPFLRGCLDQALDDPEVQALTFVIASGGGYVSQLFDLVDAIFQARGSKPIWAILNESAYSAAYAIASACDRVVVPRTGGTGSIGVVNLHTDITQFYEKMGVKITLFQAGDRKTDTWPEKPLTPEAKERFQASVDALAEIFYTTVARNRGLDANAIRAQQAMTFMGDEGVKQGLADAVMDPASAFADLKSKL